MHSIAYQQILFLLFQCLIVASLLLLLFRLRSVFGLGLLFTALGVFQFMQVFLVNTILIEVAPGILVSPGSTVLFSASLFTILIIYIREDAIEARKVIYALVSANLVLTLFQVVISWSIGGEGVKNIYNLPKELFIQNTLILLVGSLVLFVDAFITILLYEAVSKYVSSLFLRIFFTMALVLSIDTTLFTVGAFSDTNQFRSILVSNFISQNSAALVYSIIFTIYLVYFDKGFKSKVIGTSTFNDIFHTLTFRQKYEKVLKEKGTQKIELQENQEYNRMLFDQSIIGLALAKMDGQLVDVNKAYADIIGYSVEETLKLTYWDITPEKYKEQELKQLELLATVGKFGPYEKEYIHKKGQFVPVRLKGNIIEQKGEKFILSSVEDITVLKRSKLISDSEKNLLELITKKIPLSKILEKIVLFVESFSEKTIASILLLDDDGLHLHYGAAPHLPDEYNNALEGAAIGPNAGSCGTAAYRKEPVIVKDIEVDPYWDNYRELARTHGLRACWSTPIINFEGKVLGTFAMYYNEPRSPIEEDFKLIDKATNLVKIAIEHNKVEKALSESEELLRLSTELANVAAWEFDFITNSMSRTKNHDSLYGLEIQKKWLFETFLNATHPEDREMSNTMIQKSVAIGGPDEYKFDFRVVYPDQSIHWLNVIGKVVKRNKEGKGILVRGFLIDITDRKLTAEALKESEIHFRQLFEKNPQIMWIYDVESLQFKDVNESAIIKYGYSKEEFLSLTLKDIRPIEDVPQLLKNISESKDEYQESGQWRHRKKDGKLIYVEIISHRILFDHKAARLVLVNDVTDRKIAEEELEENNQFVESIVNLSPVIKYIYDIIEYKNIYSNDGIQRILGYSTNEIKNMGEKVIATIMHPDDYKAYLEVIFPKYSVVKDNEIITNKFRIKNKNGKWHWFDVREIIYVRQPDGTPKQVLGIAYDITENMIAEKQIIEQSNQLRELNSHLQTVRENERTIIARDIHDELGQILTSIKLNIGLLNRQIITKPKDITLDKISEELKTISALLDISIKQIRKLITELRPEYLDNLGLVPAIENFISNFTKSSGIKCVFKNNINNVKLDSKLNITLFRIIQESLTNVARHSKATKVIVELKVKDKNLILLVKDNGMGFDKNKLKNKNSFGLIGIKERALNLGSKLEIESIKGKGTTLHLIVPMF